MAFLLGTESLLFFLSFFLGVEVGEQVGRMRGTWGWGRRGVFALLSKA